MKVSKKAGNYMYFIFRVLFGLLILQHGTQKLFGALGGQQAELFSLIGLAGVIEFLGGILIILGLFTRITALIGGLELIVAYFMVHAKQGFFPIANGGELALLFVLGFLVLLAFGAKKWSLDDKFFRKW